MTILSKLKAAARNPASFLSWDKYRLSYLYRCVLPRLKEIELCGVRLDVASVSLRMKEVIRSGAYENCEVKMCDKILVPGDRVLELGGAIGFIGIYCQKKIGVRDYFSVEANPETVKLLRGNYALNGLEPKVLAGALSGEPGDMEFFASADFFASSSFAAGAGSMPEKITVRGMTLDQILGEVPFECTAMIVDVEGAERFVNPSQIPPSVNKLVIELHPDILGVSGMFDYLAELHAAGFRVVDFFYHSFALIRR